MTEKEKQMVDANVKLNLELPPAMLEQIHSLTIRVERAAEVSGVAEACAITLRRMSEHVGTAQALSPSAAVMVAAMADQLDAAVKRANQHMQPMSQVRPGDVVQVDPQGDELGFGGAFMIVERAESWGLVGYVRVPGANGGDAFTRVGHGQYAKVGVAEWMHDPLAVVDGRRVGDVVAQVVAEAAVWKAAMDGETCPACRAKHGTFAGVGTPQAPPHPACTSTAGCRCVIATPEELHG